MTTVSARLLEEHGQVLRPGAKGECPFCQHTTFSLKPDDTLGKCFHPACGQVLTVAQTQGQQSDLARFLGGVYRDFHAELLALASGQRNAYTYVRDERGIHPTVIAEAMLGVVPAAFDVMGYAQPLLTEAEEAMQALQSGKPGRPTKAQQRAQERLDALKEAAQRLHDCLTHHAGWLVFVYTTAAHQPCALRLREPYAKHFVSFKPGRAGLFGRDLFTPYTSPERQDVNDFLIVTEGEFNALQVQSVALHAGQSYVNACAVGSVTTADTTTLARVTQHPVIVYDHDAHGAGLELVKAVQKMMPVEACTTPEVDSDLDSYLGDFGQDYGAAWDAGKALIAAREPRGRVYSLTGEEFFDYPVTRGTKVFTPKLLGDALRERQTYCYAAERLWVYRKGVYLPCGETTLRAEAQQLLGNERRETRIEEALRYVEVACPLADDRPQTPAYLNLRNGRLNLATLALEDHTPTWFSTVQLPHAWEPEATCPDTLAFVHAAMRGRHDQVQVLRAYMKAVVTGRVDLERYLELLGPGGTGKGTYTRLLTALVGRENTFVTELKHLETNRFETSNLRGKLFMAITDAERYSGSVNQLKAIIGEDAVRMEEKYRPQTSEFAQVMVLVAAEEAIQSADYTSGLVRRRLSMTFTHKPATPSHLLSWHPSGWRGALAAELPGLLNWVLTMPDAQMEALLRDTTVRVPSLQAAWKQALVDTNPLADWANDRLVHVPPPLDKDDKPPRVNVGIAKPLGYTIGYEQEDTWLYPNYRAWIDGTGGRALSQRRFTGVLENLCTQQLRLPGVSHHHDREGSHFLGLRLRTTNDADMPLLITTEPTLVMDVMDSVTDETHTSDGCDRCDDYLKSLSREINKNGKKEGFNKNSRESSCGENPSHPSQLASRPANPLSEPSTSVTSSTGVEVAPQPPPCAVCKGTARWQDGAVLRCVHCEPESPLKRRRW